MSDNLSISHLRDAQAGKYFFERTPEGRFAADLLKRESGNAFAEVYNKRYGWTQWADMIEEHRNDLPVVTDCAEARAAIDLARGSKSTSLSIPPLKTAANWLRLASIPHWYFFRRQIELCDPDYWSDQKNVLREMLANPQWCTVPAEIIRGELERLLPRSNT